MKFKEIIQYSILLGFETGWIFSSLDRVSGVAEGTGLAEGRFREKSRSGVERLRVERLLLFDWLSDDIAILRKQILN